MLAAVRGDYVIPSERSSNLSFRASPAPILSFRASAAPILSFRASPALILSFRPSAAPPFVIPSERSESRNLHSSGSRSLRNVFSRRGAEVRRGAENNSPGRDARTTTLLLHPRLQGRDFGVGIPPV